MTSWTRTAEIEVRQALFLGRTVVKCPLPDPTGSYVIKVANRDELYSNEAIVLNYNDKCFSCNFLTGTCALNVSEQILFLIIEIFVARLCFYT